MRSLITLFLILGPFFLRAHSPDVNWQRKQILRLAKLYSPDAYRLLTAEPAYAIEKFTDAGRKQALVSDFGTVVHETCHRRNYMIGVRENGAGYYVGEGIEIGVPIGEVYNAHELNKFVSNRLQKNIFRYDTYIGNEDPYLGSQINGIYGMMDEFSAYYQGTLASFNLYNYYLNVVAKGYIDAESWLLYIGDVCSSLSSYYEFKVFISWYLLYAKKEYPRVYKDCMNNLNLRVAYTLIEKNFKQLVFQYFYMREHLVGQLEKAGHNVSFVNEADMGIVMEVFDRYGNMQGVGVQDEEIQLLRKILKQPEHKILEQFEVKDVNKYNYQSYLSE